jgi:hypothetical protein
MSKLKDVAFHNWYCSSCGFELFTDVLMETPLSCPKCKEHPLYMTTESYAISLTHHEDDPVKNILIADLINKLHISQISSEMIGDGPLSICSLSSPDVELLLTLLGSIQLEQSTEEEIYEMVRQQEQEDIADEEVYMFEEQEKQRILSEDASLRKTIKDLRIQIEEFEKESEISVRLSSIRSCVVCAKEQIQKNQDRIVELESIIKRHVKNLEVK